jgi:Ca-activated chloride channel family protein
MSGIQTTILGQHLRILMPLFLWLAPAGLLVGAFAAYRAWQRQRTVAALVPPHRLGAVLRGGGAAPGIAHGALLGLGLFFLLAAAAGPQCGERTELVKRTGIDLVVALDASTSMLARDVRPSRLDRARLEVLALVDRLKGDRVGLVVFAGDAFVQCPLTTDYSAARLFLRAVDPAAMPQQGTAIASALYVSKRLLDGGGRGNAGRAVLLITDGEDQQGDAQQAAAALGEAGVRIYAVPVGNEAGEPIPLLDKDGNVTGYKKDRDNRTVLTRTDVAGLRELASRGNGLVLRGTSGELGVLMLLPELDKLQKGEVESRLSVQYDDKHLWLAWPAFALLCVAAAFGEGSSFLRRRSQA